MVFVCLITIYTELLKAQGKVCLVTGATRGIGKGIAIQLARNGAKVYITGRTLERTEHSRVIGSLKETVNDIESNGGICVAIQCDHSKETDIENLFDIIRRNDGRLDILVNNAFSGNKTMLEEVGKPFWEQNINMWEDVNNVGLKNNYMCAIYASRLMVPKTCGLIVNISSTGACAYSFNPAYGVGKAAVDRMTADCALELRKHNVAFVSLWPGPVGSDSVLSGLQEAERNGVDNKELQEIFKTAETPQFVGKCVVSLATDPRIMEKSGTAFSTKTVAEEYGVKDEDGHAPVEVSDHEILVEFFTGHIR